MQNICAYLQTRYADGIALDCGTDGVAWCAQLVYEQGPQAGQTVTDSSGKPFAYFDACEAGANGRNGLDVLATLDAHCAAELVA